MGGHSAIGRRRTLHPVPSAPTACASEPVPRRALHVLKHAASRRVLRRRRRGRDRHHEIGHGEPARDPGAVASTIEIRRIRPLCARITAAATCGITGEQRAATRLPRRGRTFSRLIEIVVGHHRRDWAERFGTRVIRLAAIGSAARSSHPGDMKAP